MAKQSVEELVEVVKGMTVLELAQFRDALKEEFGVTAAAPVMAVAAAGAPAAAADAAAEEVTSFNVVLTSAGDKKINVIKAVREVTSLGLKEAKDLVEAAPAAVKEGINKEEADALKAKFEAEGASVEIKPAG